MAQQQAKTIYESIIKIYPKHKKEFTENYQRLNNQFVALQKSYESLLHTPGREFVTSHEAIVLNPLEGLSKQEITNKEDYFSVMTNNLANLKKALGVEK